MKVTYITHSSFLVETKYCYLLFDYFRGKLPIMDIDKPIYIFASHKHEDHFSKEIFHFVDTMKKVTFVLSHDIKYLVPKEIMDYCIITRANEIHEVASVKQEDVIDEKLRKNLKIETLKSTDAGVAFLITIDNKVIYHAGDLNCWLWEEASKAENNDMKKRFENEILKLSGKTIDLAFLPLDPRQESYYDKGMKFFLENVEVFSVFPMHMWNEYSVIKRFKDTKEYGKYTDKILEISMPLEEFEI